MSIFYVCVLILRLAFLLYQQLFLTLEFVLNLKLCILVFMHYIALALLPI
jgi:hypothetical protein